jgi:hypothetical protein
MTFCGQCGVSIPDGVKFCPSCGAPANTPTGNSIKEPVQAVTGNQAAPLNTGARPESAPINRLAGTNYTVAASGSSMGVVKLLIAVGVMALLMGLYGFIKAHQLTSEWGSEIESLLQLGVALGGKSYMTFSQKVALIAVQNRGLFLVVGTLMVVGGLVVKNAKK